MSFNPEKILNDIGFTKEIVNYDSINFFCQDAAYMQALAAALQYQGFDPEKWLKTFATRVRDSLQMVFTPGNKNVPERAAGYYTSYKKAFPEFLSFLIGTYVSRGANADFNPSPPTTTRKHVISSIEAIADPQLKTLYFDFCAVAHKVFGNTTKHQAGSARDPEDITLPRLGLTYPMQVKITVKSMGDQAIPYQKISGLPIEYCIIGVASILPNADEYKGIALVNNVAFSVMINRGKDQLVEGLKIYVENAAKSKVVPPSARLNEENIVKDALGDTPLKFFKSFYQTDFRKRNCEQVLEILLKLDVLNGPTGNLAVFVDTFAG